MNLLTEEGRLDDSVSDVALPDGVREALGRRLDQLSEEANELLTTASVVGREFEYETLSLLTGHDDEALLQLVEEGLESRVIEELDRPGRYLSCHIIRIALDGPVLWPTGYGSTIGTVQVGRAAARSWPASCAARNQARMSNGIPHPRSKVITAALQT